MHIETAGVTAAGRHPCRYRSGHGIEREHKMMRHALLAAALLGVGHAALIELNPTNPGHAQQIIQHLDNCDFDLIVDVRSQYYYENWRVKSAAHHPFTGNGLHNFDPTNLAARNISKIAFYCWTQPWQSEPAARWLHATHGQGIDVYDLKGLSYLDDIPGFCKFLHATPQAISVMSPQCATTAGTHQCPVATANAASDPNAGRADYTRPSDQATAQQLADDMNISLSVAKEIVGQDQVETATQTKQPMAVETKHPETQGPSQEQQLTLMLVGAGVLALVLVGAGSAAWMLRKPRTHAKGVEVVSRTADTFDVEVANALAK
jgi:microcompartment protein CcmK/EutM